MSVSPSTAGPSRDEIARQVRRLFPRLHELRWADKPRGDEAGEHETFTPRADFAATVRDYLTKRLTGDSDKEAVLCKSYYSVRKLDSDHCYLSTRSTHQRSPASNPRQRYPSRCEREDRL